MTGYTATNLSSRRSVSATGHRALVFSHAALMIEGT